MRSYFNNSTKRLFFITGACDDEFCSADMQLLNLEQTLNRHLKQLGYQRIIYCNYHQKVYFHDLESKKLTTLEPQTIIKANSRKKTGIPAGPLGQRFIKQSSQPASPNQAEETTNLHFADMQDSSLPAMLNQKMQDSSIKTAVIFSDAGNFINHFQSQSRADINAAFNSWGGLPSSNQNIALFIIKGVLLRELPDLLSRQQWQTLAARIYTNVEGNRLSEQVIQIGSPKEAEVQNLLHYYRIKNQWQTVDWQQLSHSSSQISRELNKNGDELKTLATELQKQHSLDTKALQNINPTAQTQTALERLKSLQGLEVVSQRVEAIIAEWEDNQQRQAEVIERDESIDVERLLPPRAESISKPNLHIALTGNPGTGKTESVKLIAEIYKEQGLLSVGHMIKVTSADLVAGFVGQTAIKTAEKIQAAMGGVLFIDEAYMLNEDDFGQQAMDTIMESMSDQQGLFAVIIAGYPKEINELIESNVGLARRFSKENRLYIKDYSAATLAHIFKQHAEAEGCYIHAELTQVLETYFQNLYQRRNEAESWGNAGTVINEIYNAFNQLRINRTRQLEDPQAKITFTLADVPSEHSDYIQLEIQQKALQTLSQMVGLHSVKKQLATLINKVSIAQRRDPDSKIAPGHYIFSGHPGTGKTTVARLMGDILRDIGVLERGHLVSPKITELKGTFQGVAEEQTQAILEKSLDGILFIDEAHQLVSDEHDIYGQRAIKTLIAFIEDHRDRLCVIAAGYPKDMQSFINLDAGLESRFTNTITFDNYTAEEMQQIFMLMLIQQQQQLEQGAESLLTTLFNQWQQEQHPKFANGRSVRKLLDFCMDNQSNRLIEQAINDPIQLNQLKSCDIAPALARGTFI